MPQVSCPWQVRLVDHQPPWPDMGGWGQGCFKRPEEPLFICLIGGIRVCQIAANDQHISPRELYHTCRSGDNALWARAILRLALSSRGMSPRVGNLRGSNKWRIHLARLVVPLIAAVTASQAVSSKAHSAHAGLNRRMNISSA